MQAILQHCLSSNLQYVLDYPPLLVQARLQVLHEELEQVQRSGP